MAGTRHFSKGDIQFQLVYDRGQCADTSYLNNPYVLLTNRWDLKARQTIKILK